MYHYLKKITGFLINYSKNMLYNYSKKKSKLVNCYNSTLLHSSIHLYGSFYIKLIVNVADLNEIIFFGSLSTIDTYFFVWPNKIFLQVYDFTNFLRNDIFDIASALSSLFILKTIVRTKNFPNYEN